MRRDIEDEEGEKGQGKWQKAGSLVVDMIG